MTKAQIAMLIVACRKDYASLTLNAEQLISWVASYYLTDPATREMVDDIYQAL